MLLRLGVIFALLTFDAFAHDAKQPELSKWFMGLRNAQGESCCTGEDKFPAEAEWDAQTNGYRAKIDGRWWPVPHEKVLTGPNLAGYAMVWYYRENGRPIIRCFIAGTLS